jgi:hypothetical protein
MRKIPNKLFIFKAIGVRTKVRDIIAVIRQESIIPRTLQMDYNRLVGLLLWDILNKVAFPGFSYKHILTKYEKLIVI